jgi:hypothetical protein
MVSLLARALIEDSLDPIDAPRDPRRSIDRVLLTSFWRPTVRDGFAPVLPLGDHGTRRPSPKR